MKVKVTVENLETGEKDSVIGDGMIAYVNMEENRECTISLGNFVGGRAISNISSEIVRNTSKRHPKGTAGVYEDIIDRLKEDAVIARLKSSAMTPQELEKKPTDAIDAVMTPQELEKKLIDAIRSALKDEA